MANNEFLGIDIEGAEEIKAKIAKLPPAAADAGVDAVAQYFLSVLRLNAPQRYVTRKDAYGVTFFTAKQRKWFFWALRSNKIQVPYVRTQGHSRGWKAIGSGAKQIIANEAPGITFVRGKYPGEQSRHENKVGWVPMVDEVKNRMSTAMDRFSGAVARTIKKLGLA
jgi:hypothetical protein